MEVVITVTFDLHLLDEAEILISILCKLFF